MIIRNNDTHAVIKWRISDCCNFQCDYCIRQSFVVHANGLEDSEKCLKALPEVIRIAEEMEKNTGKKIKVDLIGGEITIIPNMQSILDKLTNSIVDKVNITTNAETIPFCLNKKISMTCSYHPGQTKKTIEEWFDYVAEKKEFVNYLKVETVATENATHIEKFISLAEKHGLEYQVEEDLFNENLTGKACSSTKSNKRYTVIDDNGEKRDFSTRNEFLKKYGEKGSIPSGYFFCSRDQDYVYIEQDNVWLCSKEPKPVSEFHPVKRLHPCYRGREGHCTLCGNITVRTYPLFTFEKEKL